MSYDCCGQFKVGQNIYDMIACNFLFNFILKELFYVKNNSSKYELKVLHYRAGHGLRRHVADTTAVQCTDHGTEELRNIS
jgi:hypothetical protein